MEKRAETTGHETKKIKDMQFLPKTTAQSVASQANIQEVISCNTKNGDTTGNETQIASGNTVSIQVDFHELNTYINNIHSTNREL